MQSTNRLFSFFVKIISKPYPFYMNIYSVFRLLFLVCLALTGCKKGGVTKPITPGTKAWLVKDISFAYTGCTSPTIEHRTFTYNDQAQIIRYVDSDGCNRSAVDITYDAQGKITQIGGFAGTVQYNNTRDFITSLVPDDAIHNSTLLFSWNLHGNSELDEKVLTGGPSIFGRPLATYYDYAYIGNGFHGQDSHIEGQPVQTDITVFSEGTGTSFPNPFHVGRTAEQIFLYNFFASFGPEVMLGSSLPNATFAFYVYPTGTKETRSHFNYNYTLDANNNVVKIIEMGAQDAPNFGTFVPGVEFDITYELH
jgi:hypothetical protein